MKLKQATLFGLAAAMLLSLMTSTANAAAPFYKIEVIVFESLALKGWTEEFWPADLELPNTDNTSSVYGGQQKPLWIKLSGKELGAKANTLNKRGYRVLFHEAWSQAAYANKNAPRALIDSNNQYGSSVLGTVRLYKTRFAHVDFDLQLEKRIPEKVQAAFAEQQQISLNNLPGSWRFNLQESRKIKPGELHYLDHPMFGVLVSITPIEE